MDIKEIYKKIFELLSKNNNSVDAQQKIDSEVEKLVMQINDNISKLSNEDKDTLLLPFLKDFHNQKFRSYILRTLENNSTVNIDNFLLDEILLEDDVSGVMPYLSVVTKSDSKDIIRDKVNDIYISGKVNPSSKEFNNLCTLLFYMGVNSDVVDKMKTDVDILEGTSKDLVSGILEKIK